MTIDAYHLILTGMIYEQLRPECQANLLLLLGVVGHEGSTVLVVLNGLRLLAYQL